MLEAGKEGVLLCALWTCACSPCESYSSAEMCDRLLAGYQTGCSRTVDSDTRSLLCFQLFFAFSTDPAEVQQADPPLLGCDQDTDRFCTAQVDRAAGELASGLNCDGWPPPVRLACYPE